jgi:hypothetical protein
MERLTDAFNHIWVGLILGLIGPVFGFLTFFAITSHSLTLAVYWRFLLQNEAIHSSILSVSLIFNLVFFFAGTRLDMLRLSQGVIGGTLLYAPFVIYFKYAL